MRITASSIATSIALCLAAACGPAEELAEGADGAAAAIVSYQAENATLSGGSVSSANPGYTGSGYATFSASSSASVEWTVSVPTAKTYSVVIRFANGSG
ncbi:MAG TPA: CBM35 domain-containing protein, partial [Anaeromyxobacter sp.]|nr:CBM35 domain-containing protein [Anaeromyxobacter sp.]